MTALAALTATFKVPVNSVDADTNASTIVCIVPWAGTITAVTYIPNASLTGDDTESRTVALYNRETGAGTTLVADMDFVTGTDLDDNVATAIGLTATAEDLAVAADDVLEWVSTAVVDQTGLADPGGLVTVTISRS